MIIITLLKCKLCAIVYACGYLSSQEDKSMKRFISILLLFSLLAGCSKLPVLSTDDSYADSSAATGDSQPTESVAVDPDFIPAQEAMVAVSVPATTQNFTADNGNVIFQYIYQTPYLTTPDADAAEKITIDLLKRIDVTRANADALHAAAKASYSGSSDWTPYLYQITYNPYRIDPGVLSFFGLNVQYSGASHPDRTGTAANYDMLTGDVLTLAGIMAPGASANDFCELVIAELTANKESLKIYDHFEETVRYRFEADPSQDEGFYFTQEGLCFFFDPMELAPYSTGVVHVEIPYQKLSGLLYDGYFPDEQDYATGTIIAHRHSDDKAESFTQIAELTLDPGGEMIFLYSDASVRNIRIEVGAWDILGIAFTPAYTAFAAYSLTPGDAIMLETYIPDTMPNLRLNYQSQGKTLQLFISQSGKDGSIILYE